jgi:hypothetical protein
MIVDFCSTRNCAHVQSASITLLRSLAITPGGGGGRIALGPFAANALSVIAGGVSVLRELFSFLRLCVSSKLAKKFWKD